MKTTLLAASGLMIASATSAWAHAPAGGLPHAHPHVHVDPVSIGFVVALIVGVGLALRWAFKSKGSARRADPDA